MKKEQILILALLSTTISASFSLVAWERKPMDLARCQQQGKSVQRCQSENAQDNEYNFTALLSPQVFKIYEDFTPDQKQRSMDYADGDNMDPDDAVTKVADEAGIEVPET